MDVLISWPGGDWQATARLAATLVIGYLALMWLATVIWTYRDISARTRDPISQAVSVSIVVVLPLIGLPIYMALRPAETLQHAYDREIEQEAILADIQTLSACPSCRRPAEADFRVCAYCGTALKEPCPRCNQLMLHAWRYCPHCATPRAMASAPVAPPASRAAPRLDFSAGDEAYDEPAREPVAAATAASSAASSGPSNASNGANGANGAGSAPRSGAPSPLARRRPISRVGGTPDGDTPRADASRNETPRPAPVRRAAED